MILPSELLSVSKRNKTHITIQENAHPTHQLFHVCYHSEKVGISFLSNFITVPGKVCKKFETKFIVEFVASTFVKYHQSGV